MRSKVFYQQEPHKEVKRARFLQGVDERTANNFVKIAKLELFKAKARALLPSLPKEDGYSFIPNSFLDELMKENFEANQDCKILRIFSGGVANE